MSSKRRFTDDRVAGLLGLAFDADDGHKRITRGKNFLLAGGSDETHSWTPAAKNSPTSPSTNSATSSTTPSRSSCGQSSLRVPCPRSRQHAHAKQPSSTASVGMCASREHATPVSIGSAQLFRSRNQRLNLGGRLQIPDHRLGRSSQRARRLNTHLS